MKAFPRFTFLRQQVRGCRLDLRGFADGLWFARPASPFALNFVPSRRDFLFRGGQLLCQFFIILDNRSY